MKGPQKACCWEFLKRKLDRLMKSGSRLHAELVATRLTNRFRSVKLLCMNEGNFDAFMDQVPKALEQYLRHAAGNMGIVLQDDKSEPEKGSVLYELCFFLRKAKK